MDSFLKPLTALVPSSLWPDELTSSADGDTIFDRIFFTDFHLILGPQSLGAYCTLIVIGEVAVGVPGIEGLTFVVAPGAVAGTTSIACQISWAERNFDVTLKDLRLALRFPPNLLAPVAPAPDQPVPEAAQIEVRGSITVDEGFDIQIFGFDSIHLLPAMIGHTGLIIEADGVILDLSCTTTPQQILDAGFDDDFIGIFMKKALLHLPDGMSVYLPSELEFENCAIGTEGFSGRILANWTPQLDSAGTGFGGDGAGNLFGIPFGLRKFAIEFKRGAIISSDIQCELILPFFEQPIGVELGLDVDGNFSATLSSVQPAGVTRNAAGLIEFEKPGILKLSLDSLGFEKRGDDFLVKLSGRIKLLYGNFDWPEVDVKELSIDQNGHIHIEGGWIDLPKSASLDFDGFPMELTKIGFGNTDNGRKWVGFSGSIWLVDELSFGASVDGLKVLWDSSGLPDIQLSDIKVELKIPDVLSFHGSVAYFQDVGTKGFQGDVALTLASPKLALDARLIVGRISEPTAYNFFYILIGADFPAGVPLGQTNLAFYGFTGLLADNMAPNKNANEEWYDWYRAEPIGAIDKSKWMPTLGHLALGAGITIGTATDNGYAAASKGLLILLLPGPLLVLNAKANMLQDRSKLSGKAEADYRALAVLDKRAGTFLLNIEPRYKWDTDTGSMIEISGVAEGFFNFNDPDAWHLYLGQEPEPKRIRAKILKGLLPVDAFLMLDRQGMRLGAHTGWDKSYHAGPLAIDLRASLEGKADVSWRPIQVDGALTLDGTAGLRAHGFSSTVSVNALLAIQTPNPYHVHGEFRVKLKTPWPLPDPSARIKLDWGSSAGEPAIGPALASVSAEHLKTTQSWELDQSDSTGPVLPLDAKLLLSFNRPTADRALIGGNAAPSPSPEKVGSLEVAYELVGLELKRRERGSQATGATEAQKMEGEGESGDLYGMWLPLPDGDKSAGKLQLWSRSPFTYTRNTGRSYLDWFTANHPDYPCPPEESAEEFCTDFESFTLGQILPRVFNVGDLIFESLHPDQAMWPMILQDDPAWIGTKQAVLLTLGGAGPSPILYRIHLPEEASRVRLYLRLSVGKIAVKAFGNGQLLATEERGSGDHNLILEAQEIEYLELEPIGLRSVKLSRICYTSQSDQDRVTEIGSIRDRLQEESQRWCTEDYILKPNSEYQLNVKTRARQWHDNDELEPEVWVDEFKFLTAGPPGFIDTIPDSTSRLGNLNLYVNEGAASVGRFERPVYRGYDIRLVFNENYVERMYNEADRSLHFDLRDQNGMQARDEHGMPVTINTVWARDPYTQLSDRDEHWLRTLDQTDCSAGVNRDSIPLNNSLEARLPGWPLAPLALIEARVIADGQEVYHSSFVTSRFVTFTHHIHSCTGVVWDYEQMTEGSSDSLLTDGEIVVLEDLVHAAHDGDPGFDEGAAFEKISQFLFKLGQRRLPDLLEITSLSDTTRSYALLLESPEPIDWGRASLLIHHAAEVAPTELSAMGSVKIVEVAFGQRDNTAAPVYNTEWVDALLCEDTNLNGFTLEHNGAFGSGDSPFITYYRFNENSVMPAGSIIRVHSGAQADDAEPALERVHRYVTSPDFERKWLLNNTGDTLRLLDVSGREVFRWSFLPNNVYQELEAILIRNVDQTRAFIFFSKLPQTPVGEVPNGRLRLEWTFLRNVGASMPLLKRGGSDQPEITSLEFDLPAQWL